MSAYWPEFAQQGKERITVRQVRPWTAAEVPGCPRGPGSHIRPQTLEPRGGRHRGGQALPRIHAGAGLRLVKNVEAARGEAVIRQGRRRLVHLVAVPPEKRAPILREYVRIASSGRQHFPLPIGAPLSDFQAIAGRYPCIGSNPHEANRHIGNPREPSQPKHAHPERARV